MTVGSRDKGSNAAHNKAELYSHSTSSWKSKASYAFHEAIWTFEILSYSDSFILFGGFDSVITYSITTIAKFNPVSNEWTKLGSLQHDRHAFGIIEVHTKYLVMGGQGEMRTETCELKNEKIECTSREPTLNEFRFYPALMIVPSDYADNC